MHSMGARHASQMKSQRKYSTRDAVFDKYVRWFDIRPKEGRKEMFYLTSHSTHLINMAVIWRRVYGKGPFRL